MSATLLTLIGRQIFPPRRPFWVVDEKIALLVDAMNATRAIETIASCQGHAWPPASVPYVYFKASPRVATRLQRILDDARSKNRLGNTWILEGIFCEGNLQFLLVAPRLQKWSMSLIRSLLELKLFRREVDQDIAVLAELVKEINYR